MLNFLKDKSIIKSNQVLGVHCYLQSTGDMLFDYVFLSRNKGNLTLEKTGSLSGSIEQLASEIPVQTPVYLSIDGKGILTKKVTPDPSKSLIHQAIPNASEDDFMVQQFGEIENQTFISIIRKDSLDGLLTSFKAHKFSIVGITIGPLKAAKLWQLFDNLPSTLLVGNYQITRNDQFQMIDFSKEADQTTVSYKIGDQDISSTFLLPYYHALTYYVPDENKLAYPTIVEQFEEYTSKRIFTISGWSALIILFLILLVNMMFFTSFADKQKSLEAQVSGNKELLNKLKILKDELAWKEKVLGQAGIIKINRMSYYADQIAISVPEEISLEKLEIHPVVAKIRKQKEIEIQADQMAIDGVARSSQVLNDWVHVLKQKSWIADVLVINYSKDDKSTSGIFSIEIKIYRKNKT